MVKSPSSTRTMMYYFCILLAQRSAQNSLQDYYQKGKKKQKTHIKGSLCLQNKSQWGSLRTESKIETWVQIVCKTVERSEGAGTER